ncbi:MAG: histidine phosphotransferase family protein [Rickettsiales bacterium]|jgi:histidine phosphotransferase ChpT|nr:histidine phosphotransferase family protein [Rickettsiales bacterium]
MVDQIRLLELMSARMFHDLAGPIGAVNNSLEFFEEENQEIRDKALGVVKSSSNEAILRLKYFRQAYGPVNDQEISLRDALPLVEEFLEKTKVTLICSNDNNIIISSSFNKLIMNIVIIAVGAMIYGGDLEIIATKEELKITLKGKDLILSDETISLLKGDLSYINLSSANIQIYYTHMVMNDAKYSITINKTSSTAEFIIK